MGIAVRFTCVLVLSFFFSCLADLLYFIILAMDFIFTEKGFVRDGESSELSPQSFYEYCFRDLEKGASITEEYVKEIASYFIDNLLSSTGIELEREKINPSYETEEIDRIASDVPFAVGSRYVDRKWVKRQLDTLLSCYRKEIASFHDSVDLYFNRKNESLLFPSRIYFHLVEEKNTDYPFAFMATYTTKDEEGDVHHYPLRFALTEYKDDMEGLSRLISPISRLSVKSDIIKGMIASGRIFYPVRFTQEEAYDFLVHASEFEGEGIECRIPNFWRKRNRYTSLGITVRKGSLGAGAVISLKPQMVYEGVAITEKEVRALLEMKDGLAFLKGRWVALDKEKLKALLESDELFSSPMSTADLVKYSSGIKKSRVKLVFSDRNWLDNLASAVSQGISVPESASLTLRPYQEEGFRYLWAMYSLGFGFCLADDMGLGKTVQVLAFLEMCRVEKKAERVLLVLPSSLIGNWESEIGKFTPSLDYSVYHGTGRTLDSSYLTLTTYGVVAKDENLQREKWDIVILDEAQYIKNSATKAYKALSAMDRKDAVLLTGTPVENDLMNLWSLMDYINSGFLGTKTEFSRYARSVDISSLSSLRRAISPFILRRLKSDKSIIKDLPDKVESILYVNLKKDQIILYNKIVSDLETAMNGGDGEFEKKGKVLAAIAKLKAVCNHPDQYYGESSYRESESGKFELLKEVASTIHSNREKVLVFTQFREIIPALDELLSAVFGKKGLIIDGTVSAKKRTEIVKAFQRGEADYMVLSLRAAGVGLNLTRATNVIHFDRWWNPAVENQATDRAYRIGQKEKVMVYKFVSKNTIEEKIDDLIQSKKALSDSLLCDLDSDILTKLSSTELLEAIRFSGGVK